MFDWTTSGTAQDQTVTAQTENGNSMGRCSETFPGHVPNLILATTLVLGRPGKESEGGYHKTVSVRTV